MTVDDPSPYTCPTCGERIPSRDVKLELRAAHCRACETPFSLPAGLYTPDARPALPKGVSVESGEPSLPLPGSYRDAPPQGDLVVRRRWFQWGALFGVAWAIVWNGFVFSSLATATFDLGNLFGYLMFGGIGLFLGYRSVAQLLNSTWLEVSAGQLTVRHGPLPWKGGAMLPASSILQLYFERRTNKSSESSTDAWEVRAKTRDGHDILLFPKLSGREQAQYLEWLVEHHLGVRDDPGFNQT